MNRVVLLERIKRSRIARLTQAVNERYGWDHGGYLAASIAYYGFLSLFPLLLLGLSIAGFVLSGDPALHEQISRRIADAVPGLSGLIGNNLDRVVANRAGAGVIGLVGLLWSGTAVVGAARYSLVVVFRRERIQGLLRQRLWLVGTTVWLGALAMVTTAAAAVFGGLRAVGPLGVALLILVPLVTVALDGVLFLAAFRVLLRGEVAAARLWPGAVFAALGWAVLKLAGAWYVSRAVGGASAVYGTFAATVAMLLLMYLAGRLFVYGAELNAVLMEEEQGGGVMEGARADEGSPAREPAEMSPVEARSSAELARAIGTDMVTLVRKEIELGKAEIREGIAARVLGAVALGAAATFGLFGLGFLASAGAWGLDLAVPSWVSRLIVGGAFLLLAGVAAVVGLGRLRGAPLAPRRAKESIKEDVEWARAQLRR